MDPTRGTERTSVWFVAVRVYSPVVGLTPWNFSTWLHVSFPHKHLRRGGGGGWGVGTGTYKGLECNDWGDDLVIVSKEKRGRGEGHASKDEKAIDGVARCRAGRGRAVEGDCRRLAILLVQHSKAFSLCRHDCVLLLVYFRAHRGRCGTVSGRGTAGVRTRARERDRGSGNEAGVKSGEGAGDRSARPRQVRQWRAHLFIAFRPRSPSIHQVEFGP